MDRPSVRDMDLVVPWNDTSLCLAPKGGKKGEMCQDSQQACQEDLLSAPWLSTES